MTDQAELTRNPRKRGRPKSAIRELMEEAAADDPMALESLKDRSSRTRLASGLRLDPAVRDEVWKAKPNPSVEEMALLARFPLTEQRAALDKIRERGVRTVKRWLANTLKPPDAAKVCTSLLGHLAREYEGVPDDTLIDGLHRALWFVETVKGPEPEREQCACRECYHGPAAAAGLEGKRCALTVTAPGRTCDRCVVVAGNGAQP